MFPERMCLVNPVALRGYTVKRGGDLEEWGTVRPSDGPHARIRHINEGT